MTTPTLTVRLRDEVDSRVRDWPWVLIDQTGCVWGDYPSRIEAEAALHGATHCNSCDTLLGRPDGHCPNVWCDKGPASREER